MKMAYVILHYIAKNDTIECADAILNHVDVANDDEIQIVIVDNASPDGSGDELEALYENRDNVTVIKTAENLGFAKGNNVGFRYAKDCLKADFIVLLNNDTVITQREFNHELKQLYTEFGYFVLGPDIVTRDGFHQNPGEKQSWSYKELFIDRMKKRIRSLMCRVHLGKLLFRVQKKRDYIYRSETLLGERKDTILHGACMIFSPEYLQRFDGLSEETFLYMEEDILKLYADVYGFLMLYSSRLSILHKENVSTDLVESNFEKREIARNRHLIKSSLAYTRIKRRLDRQNAR